MFRDPRCSSRLSLLSDVAHGTTETRSRTDRRGSSRCTQRFLTGPTIQVGCLCKPTYPVDNGGQEAAEDVGGNHASQVGHEQHPHCTVRSPHSEAGDLWSRSCWQSKRCRAQMMKTLSLAPLVVLTLCVSPHSDMQPVAAGEGQVIDGNPAAVDCRGDLGGSGRIGAVRGCGAAALFAAIIRGVRDRRRQRRTIRPTAYSCSARPAACRSSGRWAKHPCRN